MRNYQIVGFLLTSKYGGNPHSQLVLRQSIGKTLYYPQSCDCTLNGFNSNRLFVPFFYNELWKEIT